MWAKTKKPVNWVANKASCTPVAALDLFEAHFNSLLDEMEKVLSGREADYRFEMERKSSRELAVSRILKSDGTALRIVLFEAHSKTITVRYRDGSRTLFESLTINLKWDFEHAKCRFEIGEECYSLWKLSQRTLFDLFFRTEYDEGQTHFHGDKFNG